MAMADRPWRPGADIDFLRPGRIGAILVAEALERASAGRSGIYDVIVRDKASGDVPAVMRGRSRVIGGSIRPSGEAG